MNFRARLSVFIVILAFSLAVFADVNDAGVKVKWGYTGKIGPQHWGALNPSFALCKSGKKQSPIDISKKISTSESALTIQYQPGAFDIIEDGETDLQIGATHTVIFDGHGVQLNYPQNSLKEQIELNGTTYRLVQFHFHVPGENRLDGREYPMEIHFVHQSEDNRVAVIGVFVAKGKENKTLQNIKDHFPADQGKEHRIKNQRINPDDLLPAARNYYSFMGSLTTPPCTEGLQWQVMAKPITASAKQIAAFAKEMGGANARPIQPLQQRKVVFHTANQA